MRNDDTKKRNEFWDSGKPATRGDLTRVEQELGFRLSEEFREFAQTINGGIPVRKCFSQGDSEFSLERLFSLNADLPVNDLEIEQGDDVPNKFLSIGLIEGNDRLLLRSTGEVYRLDTHELSLSFLTSGFSSFLEGLFDDGQNERSIDPPEETFSIGATREEVLEMDLNPFDENKRGLSFMKMVVKHGNLAAFEALIERYPEANLEGLLHIACLNSHGNLVSLLLDHGADPLERDGKGMLPIEWASYEDSDIKLLLKNKMGGV